MLKNIWKPFSIFNATYAEQADTFLIHMNENEFVLYDYFTIKQYEENKIVLATKQKTIEINGSRLLITKITVNSIYITGQIHYVAYDS